MKSPLSLPLLGVNIDHIATLRQLRGTPYPDLLEAARICEGAGADQITVHLREDRRHIQDADVVLLRKKLGIPLNLEMAVSDPIIKIALKLKPAWVCLVPEKRQEVTTEGGLNLQKIKKKVADLTVKCHRAGIKVSCFIEPDPKTVRLAHELGADAVELHTGRYCLLTQKKGLKSKQAGAELKRIQVAAEAGWLAGIRVHAGHGFDFENVRAVAALEREDRTPLIQEYNIGHALVCRAAIVGLDRATKEMKAAILAP